MRLIHTSLVWSKIFPRWAKTNPVIDPSYSGASLAARIREPMHATALARCMLAGEAGQASRYLRRLTAETRQAVLESVFRTTVLEGRGADAATGYYTISDEVGDKYLPLSR
jgi:hypothetical protein